MNAVQHRHDCATMLSTEGAELARRRGQRTGWLRAENGSWLLTYRMYVPGKAAQRVTVKIGPAEGQGKLTKKQAERFAHEHYLQPIDQTVKKPLSMLTVGEYWVQRYEPALVTRRKYSTQSQYKSLWKNWLEPIIGNVRFWELTPEHIEQAMAAALREKMSTLTAKHIRKVASAIYTHAKRMQCASGDNPAQLVEAPAIVPVRRARALTAEQVQELLRLLPEPCNTMCLVAVSMSLNVAEMLGLCERHLNLTDEPLVLERSDLLEPHSIAVGEQLSCARRGTVKTGNRRRNVPLPKSVEDALRSLIGRNKKQGPDAPVFQHAELGTPQNSGNLLMRVLKPIGDSGGIAVTFHTLRHTHATLSKIAGMQDRDRQEVLGHGSAAIMAHYTHVSKRDGVEAIADMVTPRAKLQRVK